MQAGIRPSVSDNSRWLICARVLRLAVLTSVLTQIMVAQKLGSLYADAPSTSRPYVAITPKQRLGWFVRSTAGIESLLFAGPISAGWGTALDHPHEYGASWQGFAQRYGMRLTGISTGNAMEASLGAMWGEDPRYFRTHAQPFKKRVVNVIDLTFRAYRSDGERHFAYARAMGNVGNNFLSNAWRVPSENDWQSATVRVLEGIGGKAVGNAVFEFLPDVLNKLQKNH